MDIKESGVPIRVPATANLCVDSQDRNTLVEPSSNFLINKKASILNGFFNRVATTEVVLEWQYPNISDVIGNNTFQVSVGANTYTITIPNGFYTFKELIDKIVVLLNAAAAPAVFSVNQLTNQLVALDSTIAYIIGDTELARRLFQGTLPPIPQPPAVAVTSIPIPDPDIRPFRYLDFTSSQLTYNQELKDGSTTQQDRQVLCRWYFTYDTEPAYDAYGYPIYMGYRRFTIRRAFNPPKQIRWDPRQPVGQLRFEVFTDDQNDGRSGVFPPNLPTALPGLTQPVLNYNWDWLMTLQVSEN